MAIKKVGYTFDPFELTGLEKPKDKLRREELTQDIADAVVDYILEKVDKGESPVAGSNLWKRELSQKYKEKKVAQGGKKYSDMLLEGDMLSELKAETRPGGKIWVGIEGDQAPKADGHNNHSGKSKLPTRRFIPKKNEKFEKELLDEIKFMIKEANAEDEDA